MEPTPTPQYGTENITSCLELKGYKFIFIPKLDEQRNPNIRMYADRPSYYQVTLGDFQSLDKDLLTLLNYDPSTTSTAITHEWLTATHVGIIRADGPFEMSTLLSVNKSQSPLKRSFSPLSKQEYLRLQALCAPKLVIPATTPQILITPPDDRINLSNIKALLDETANNIVRELSIPCARTICQDLAFLKSKFKPGVSPEIETFQHSTTTAPKP
nr:ORF-3 [Hypera postica associated alphaflexivirus]